MHINLRTLTAFHVLMPSHSSNRMESFAIEVMLSLFGRVNGICMISVPTTEIICKLAMFFWYPLVNQAFPHYGAIAHRTVQSV